ncbi:MAG: hypothetical protein IJ168_11740 [Eubacterium sp.]|nr:hypothetical protein [Eubacterium sp.]
MFKDKENLTLDEFSKKVIEDLLSSASSAKEKERYEKYLAKDEAKKVIEVGYKDGTTVSAVSYNLYILA